MHCRGQFLIGDTIDGGGNFQPIKGIDNGMVYDFDETFPKYELDPQFVIDYWKIPVEKFGGLTELNILIKETKDNAYNEIMANPNNTFEPNLFKIARQKKPRLALRQAMLQGILDSWRDGKDMEDGLSDKGIKEMQGQKANYLWSRGTTLLVDPDELRVDY
jgi:hypothetical protein